MRETEALTRKWLAGVDDVLLTMSCAAALKHAVSQ
jgi:hypothetical protein